MLSDMTLAALRKSCWVNSPNGLANATVIAAINTIHSMELKNLI